MNRLRGRIQEWKKKKEFVGLSVQAQGFNNSFKLALTNDLQIPRALATVWRMVEDKVITNAEKYELLKDWDSVLGLKLDKIEEVKVPQKVKDLVNERQKLRQQEKWSEADNIRKKIEELGFTIEDTPKGSKITIY